MAVNVLLPLLIPLGEQINNGTSGLSFLTPTYDVSVKENDAPKTITTLRASSNTTGTVSYAIVEGALNGTFVLNSLTGGLTLKTPLDYETQNLYELAVRAILGSEKAYGTVNVRVLDVNDHPPTFPRPSYETQITEEDDRFLPKRILQVSADDADETDRNKLLYSLSGEAVSEVSVNDSEEWPESLSVLGDAHFAINQSNGEIFLLRALDRDAPTGRTKWMLNISVTDGANHAQTSLQINVKDINDNAPFFPLMIINATVEENGRGGEEVTQVEAIDLDDPQEGSNALLTFSLEKNVIDEDSGRPIFDIDSETGRVTTALCCLDREKTASYSLQVVATDGGGLKGTGTVAVKVEDKNDMPPKFAVQNWDIFIHESAKVNESLAFLSVDDPDITNNFSFKVIPGSGHGWNRFLLLPETADAGSLISLQPFDYEDPDQREGFRFKVQVTDKGDDWDDPLHQDSSWVIVHLVDDNDNSPVCQKELVNLTFSEDTAPDVPITQMFATDVDEDGMSQISYSVVPSSDPYETFTIDSVGQVRLRRTLDREVQRTHAVKIIATDGGYPPRSTTCSFFVSVTDINDNAPYIKSPVGVLLQENKAPQTLVELTLDDKDDWSLGHGPPFYIVMDDKAPPEIKKSFGITFNPDGDGGRGSGTLHTLLPLDREDGKMRFVPLVVSDSEGMSATVCLSVTVGDINDNPMKPGIKQIKALRLKAVRYRIPLGRIYVQDPDDWDMGAKIWQWSGLSHPMFSLDSHSGDLVAERDVSDNEYHLRFHVSDKTHRQNDVPADVFVSLKTLDIDPELYHAVVPLYVESHSPEQLITPVEGHRSPLDKIMDALIATTKMELHLLALEKITQKKQEKPYKYQSENVENYSVIWTITESKNSVDQLILTKLHELYEKTSVKISNVGIGICAHFKNLKYFLYHHKKKDYKTANQDYLSYSWLTDANVTALITPSLETVKSCNCHSKEVPVLQAGSNTTIGNSQALQIKTSPTSLTSCNPNSCLNGGQCIFSEQGPKCICPSGTENVLCKHTSRQFEGNGWAWISPLSSCSDLHISLEFRTEEQHGILFFTDSRPKEYFPNKETFVTNNIFCLQIKNGLPYLLIKIGMKKTSLSWKSQINPFTYVSNGEWHRIDIFWNKNRVDLLVDLCQRVPDYCHLSAYVFDKPVRPLDVFSNSSFSMSWDSPLQIGGFAQEKDFFDSKEYVSPITTTSFTGCIRNIRINGKITDLGNDIMHKKTSPGCKIAQTCSVGDALCSSFAQRCSKKSDQTECPCANTAGKGCEETLSPSTLTQDDMVEVSPAFPAPKMTTSIQLRFRTWNPFGQLVGLRSESGKGFVILYLFDGHLCSMVVFSVSSPSPKGIFSSLNFTLCLFEITLNDGVWHSANLRRTGNFVELWADGGDWPVYNSSLFLLPIENNIKNIVDSSEEISEHPPNPKMWQPISFIVHRKRGIRIAGKPDYDIPESKRGHKHYFDGCLDAIYMWDHYLPLPLQKNNTNWLQSSKTDTEVQKGCLNPQVCLNITCPEPMKCISIWTRHKCSCESGRILSEKGDNCLDVNECQWNPCLEGGTCINQNPGYSCICPDGFSGENCESSVINQSSSSLSLGVLVGSITWCCFIILCLLAILIFLRHRNRRRRKSSIQIETETSVAPQVSTSFVALTDYRDILRPAITETVSFKERGLAEGGDLNGEIEFTPATPSSSTAKDGPGRCETIIPKLSFDAPSNLPTTLSKRALNKTKTVTGSIQAQKGEMKSKGSGRMEDNFSSKCNECLTLNIVDDLRNYAYEGNVSTSESLSSCCSSGESFDNGKFVGGFQEVATLLNCLNNDKRIAPKISSK